MLSIEECECVEGQAQVPGCVRYVVGSAVPGPDGQKMWVKERLLTLDPRTHSCTYRVEDGNLNLDGYVARLQLSSSSGAEGEGTVVKWCFEMDPMSGCAEEVMVNSLICRLNASIEALECVARRRRSCSPSPSPSPCDRELISQDS
ncbi:hypothetical protein O6H91_11G055000 [Diphasiastrum complanatum]|nr:hypothetical protein O6H91_Y080700 [Diphasiastrum complanatum]KAJ7538575.1 hypothetical protein O6H91_11G055000 [Diphasiastrum complanatum]